jgi:hypothetical protein
MSKGRLRSGGKEIVPSSGEIVAEVELGGGRTPYLLTASHTALCAVAALVKTQRCGAKLSSHDPKCSSYGTERITERSGSTMPCDAGLCFHSSMSLRAHRIGPVTYTSCGVVDSAVGNCYDLAAASSQPVITLPLHPPSCKQM